MNKEIKIGNYTTSPKQLLFLALHLLIVISFVVEIIYSIVAFGAVAAAGSGTAGLAAGEIPFEEMAKRRMYAIELWVAAAGLAVYLGVVYRNQLTNFFTKKQDKVKDLIEENK